MSTHTTGSTVSFKPGPKSKSNMTGTVSAIVTSGEGRGKSTFLVVKCADGKDRKVRPGAATAVTA